MVTASAASSYMGGSPIFSTSLLLEFLGVSTAVSARQTFTPSLWDGPKVHTQHGDSQIGAELFIAPSGILAADAVASKKQ